jgi:uncharacterized membrane protein
MTFEGQTMRSKRCAFLAILLYTSAAVHAFAASLTPLGDLPGGDFLSYAKRVSGDGSAVVGYSNSPSGVEAYRWTADGGMTGLGELPGGDFNSTAYGVSDDGAVAVGHSSSPSGFEAFRWTVDGGMQDWVNSPAAALAAPPLLSATMARPSSATARPPRAKKPFAGRPATAWSAWATCPAAASKAPL